MSKPLPGDLAPDFTTTDLFGGEIRLQDYRNKKPAVLVFNRGFV